MDEFIFLKDFKGEPLFLPITENTGHESSDAGTSQVYQTSEILVHSTNLVSHQNVKLIAF